MYKNLSQYFVKKISGYQLNYLINCNLASLQPGCKWGQHEDKMRAMRHLVRSADHHVGVEASIQQSSNKHEHRRKYWHYFLCLYNHPMGWPLLYDTPGMFCLHGKVMGDTRSSTQISTILLNGRLDWRVYFHIVILLDNLAYNIVFGSYRPGSWALLNSFSQHLNCEPELWTSSLSRSLNHCQVTVKASRERVMVTRI